MCRVLLIKVVTTPKREPFVMICTMKKIFAVYLMNKIRERHAINLMDEQIFDGQI